MMDYWEDLIGLGGRYYDALEPEKQLPMFGRSELREGEMVVRTISRTTSFAVPYGISPAREPRPAMRKRPLL